MFEMTTIYCRSRPHERSNANITADSWPPTLNNVTGQVIKSACLTPSPTEQIALCVGGS